MAETAPEPTPAVEDPDFARRLAAGSGGGDWHYTAEDLAAQKMAEAASTGDEDADFALRLAQGTGGGDWHLSEEDKAANAAAKSTDPAVTPYVESGLSPEQQATLAAAGPPDTATPEPQSPSQPGPTPGE